MEKDETKAADYYNRAGLSKDKLDFKYGRRKIVEGFKCPRCDHVTPISKVSCSNCGGSISIKTSSKSVPTSVEFDGTVRYTTYDGGKYQQCTKCGKTFKGCLCAKCKTVCSEDLNYGTYTVPNEK